MKNINISKSLFIMVYFADGFLQIETISRKYKVAVLVISNRSI